MKILNLNNNNSHNKATNKKKTHKIIMKIKTFPKSLISIIIITIMNKMIFQKFQLIKQEPNGIHNMKANIANKALLSIII